MMQAQNKKVINLGKLLAEVFDFNARKIINSDSPATIPGWDSFQSLIMFQELEKAAGASFPIEDLQNIRNVGDIRRLLEKYQVPYI